MSCLVICMAQYILAEGPLFFVVIAIPRNMELFDVASTNARGLTVMKCIQSIKNVVYYIAHSMCVL